MELNIKETEIIDSIAGAILSINFLSKEQLKPLLKTFITVIFDGRKELEKREYNKLKEKIRKLEKQCDNLKHQQRTL